MLNERIESKWIDGLVELFQLCKVQPGEVAAVLSESQSRDVLVDMCELALARLDARVFHVVLPSPPLTSSVPIRSTGTCLSIGGLEPVISALAGSDIVIDCTVEGMLHAKELGAILKDGARLMMISNEHPEVLERLASLEMMDNDLQQASQYLVRAFRIDPRRGLELARLYVVMRKTEQARTTSISADSPMHPMTCGKPPLRAAGNGWANSPLSPS